MSHSGASTNDIKGGGVKKIEKDLTCHTFFSGSAFTDFRPQIENLPKLIPDLRIIAWDPPGYGKSIPPERKFNLNFLEDDADSVKELMETLKVDKYNVLGWSDGGITGLILAGKYPKNVDKLCIFGSNAYIVDDEIKIYNSIRDISKWSAKMREPLEKLYGADYFKKTWERWVDTFISIYAEKKGDLCLKYLDGIRAPTLILHGKNNLSRSRFGISIFTPPPLSPLQCLDFCKTINFSLYCLS